MYSRQDRPLNGPELRLVRAAIAAWRKRRASGPRRMATAIAVVILALWVLTIVTSKMLLLPTALWIAVAALSAFLIARDEKRSFALGVAPFENALAANRVEEIHVAPTGMVELEEIGDLGACYAFQVEPDKILIIRGQDYYATNRFPNSDFRIVAIPGPTGEPIEIAVHKRGKKMDPDRVVSVEAQKHLRMPAHLEILSGRLEELEKILRSAG